MAETNSPLYKVTPVSIWQSFRSWPNLPHELAPSAYHRTLPCEKMHFGSTCFYLKMKDITQGDRSFFWGFVSSARLLHSVRSRGWVWMLPEVLLPPGKTSRDQTEPWKYLIQTLGYRNFPLSFFIIKSRCSRHIIHWRCLELDTGQDLHADTITCKLGDIHKTSRLYCDLPTLWLCQNVLS